MDAPPHNHQRPPTQGVAYALAAAALFGLSTPLAKLLLRELSPWMLAALLYLGAGLGLLIVRALSPAAKTAWPARTELPWLAGAVLIGGALGPVLLMIGLRATAASSASLLLNLEGVFTALLAWGVFRESVDRRLALGMALIVAAGALLSWSGSAWAGTPLLGSLAIAGACLCWAIDNNLTRRVSALDPAMLVIAKGLVAGSVNLSVAFALGHRAPGLVTLAETLTLGFVSYGLSLALFVLALRNLGAARTGAYFALAPFVGAAAAVLLLGERPDARFYPAAAMMAAGLWLHLSERHGHAHLHEALEHSHAHEHDQHHQHAHEPGVEASDGHTHAHRHEALSHTHPHYPDLHHRHSHERGPTG